MMIDRALDTPSKAVNFVGITVSRAGDASDGL